jgi:hypothetical protein
MNFAAGLAFDVALSGSQITEAENYVRGFATCGTTFNPSLASFLFVGDSICQGLSSGGPDTVRYSDQMLALLTNGATYAKSFSNLGIAGTTVEDWQVANNLAFVNGFYDAGRPKNVIFVHLGSNRIAPHPDAYNHLKVLCASYKTTGMTVVVLDKLPRGDEMDDTDRQDFNAALAADFPTTYATRVKTGAAYGDVLLQIGSDPTIGQKGDENNATYYVPSDKVHLLPPGHAIVAGYCVTGMQSLGFS